MLKCTMGYQPPLNNTSLIQVFTFNTDLTVFTFLWSVELTSLLTLTCVFVSHLVTFSMNVKSNKWFLNLKNNKDYILHTLFLIKSFQTQCNIDATLF